ncbi:MAG TPA: leucine--tRNA ligase [Ignavibacteria bacterium]|nr:leucine--tRNA ligase [Ignavibacteria bacterium]HRJ05839.1 leucine--tRNA ligase [Ignavibacteria bacterium]HRJ86954.1 leucine--tRNA ligase [Ignavibacteria bacterium]
MKYNFTEIEKKWQDFWDKNKTFAAEIDHSKPKYYVLDFFPYPSSDGLHVGHPEGYTATDIIARYKRMKGFNVLHPMGWDAFGLPAEQFAIKTGIHPRITTQKSIDNFKRQLKSIGLSIDWSREIATVDPKYYKWTQWIFSQLYKKGLAYQAEIAVNWCPELGTVLANEEVPEQIEKGYTVVRRPMKQWMLKITEYAERLLIDLDMLDWPESTKEMQRNWIGKSEGAKVTFSIAGEDAGSVEVFTTRPDTLWGATYMVLAPEHPLVDKITTPECKTAVDIYKENAKHKSDLERQALEKEKSGVFTGAYAVNPVNNAEIPIWISDYVLMGYGTGAIMAVPAHDERDWEFATKYHIPIIEVVKPAAGETSDITKKAFSAEGVAVNSDFINGLKTEKAKKKVIEWLEAKGLGKGTVQYKLRDWLFSRQRFWGEPFPIIHLEDGTVKLLPEDELPVMLPEVENYKTIGTGESPLAGISEWVNTTDPETGKPAKRETNTMPQWAGSCWYYLRFLDPNNDKEFINKEAEKYWMPVNLYLGGAEHAVLHLLYARFWHKVLFDLGYVSTREPFVRLFHQGMILGEDSNKMSKSRGNVVNPDDVIAGYGADSLRLFEMFLGPLSATKPWSTKGIEGVYRFLNKIWRLVVNEDGGINAKITDAKPEGEAERVMHRTIMNVTEDIEDMDMKFNTCVSELMIYVNEISRLETIPRDLVVTLLKLLAPFAPHLAEELWNRMGNDTTIAFASWPEFNPAKVQKNVVTVIGQINGKVRSKIEAPTDTPDDKLIEMMKQDEKIKTYLDGKQIVKEIVVKNKLVNIVVK